jgi:serine/threonine protein kinase
VRGEAFVRIAKAMAAALEKIHGKGLVWTDLKLDNFVLLSGTGTDYFGTSGGKFVCKAIDLESAVKEKTKIVDFSPEMIAPEQVEILQGGSMSSVGNRGKDLFLSVDEPLLAYKETDIWALGIAMLHLYQGKAPITNQVSNVKAAIDKVSRYAEGTTDFGLIDVQETSLRILLQSMLNVDKKKRPNVTAVQIALKFIA